MSLIEKTVRIHFIGAGGASMSALAKLMLLKGHCVTGSDIAYGTEMEELAEWGAEVYLGSNEEIIKNSGLVVYSGAIPRGDPELAFAAKHGVPIIRRDCFLAELARDYETVIAVAGTHGKTTVTAMLAAIFKEANLLFTAHIGGKTQGGSNVYYKGNRYFITEACEYKRSFLALKTDIAVILNVDFDHPDTYADIDELYESFTSYLFNLNENGVAIINGDCDFYRMNNCAYKHICTYGYGSNLDCVADNIRKLEHGRFGFRIVHNGSPKCDIELKIAGAHNVANALAAYLVSGAVGISTEVYKRAIESFVGVERRFEYKGLCGGAEVYVDYAHHPVELRAAAAAALGMKPKGRLFAVFQPHTLTRTAALFKDFAYSFCDFDEVYIFKEFGARETSGGATAYDLFEEIKEKVNPMAQYYDTLLPLANALAGTAASGDIILVLGAGNINGLAELIT